MEPDCETTKPIAKWSSVEFLTAKQALKMKQSIEVGRFVGPKGIIKQLEKIFKEAADKDADMADLPQDTAKLQHKINDQKAVTSTLDDDIMKATKSNYEELRTQHVSNKKWNDLVLLEFDEQFAALSFKVNEQNKVKRSSTSRETWQGTKIKQHLLKGGHGEGVAKFYGAWLFKVSKSMANAPLSETEVLGEYAFLPDCVQLNPTTDFDKRFPAVFIAVEGSPYVEGLGFFQSLEGPNGLIPSKTDAMNATMIENPRWVGCQSWIQTSIDPSCFQLLKDGISKHEGSVPMVAMLNNNAKRFGAVAVPFAGAGGVFYGTQTAPVWLLLTLCEAHLCIGIAIDALERYFDSSAGDIFMKSNCFCVPILKGACVYVPAGYSIFAMCHEDPVRSQPLGRSHFVHLTLANQFMNDVGVTRDARHAIMQANHSVFDPKAPSSKMWSARKSFFETLFTSD